MSPLLPDATICRAGAEVGLVSVGQRPLWNLHVPVSPEPPAGCLARGRNKKLGQGGLRSSPPKLF